MIWIKYVPIDPNDSREYYKKLFEAKLAEYELEVTRMVYKISNQEWIMGLNIDFDLSP
jgi:hypothetical protein